MKIEKDIPIPPASRGIAGGGLAGLLSSLEIGDSVLYTRSERTARRTASDAGKKMSRKFTARKTEGGVRIWRTA